MNQATAIIERPKFHSSLPSDQDSSGRTLGQEEIDMVSKAILSGTLTSTKGEFTKSLESAFADQIGAKFCYATSSGTSALHVAYSCLGLEPGDEVITTSITDMGALSPILFQGGIPVFADVDPHSYNVTAETIAARITQHTKAIIVTHLFGA
ncbi:MAG: DegT/DnrJ/EryC1/StrS family aminotransferase, partial [Verrucomicrobiales bacterium]